MVPASIEAIRMAHDGERENRATVAVEDGSAKGVDALFVHAGDDGRNCASNPAAADILKHCIGLLAGFRPLCGLRLSCCGQLGLNKAFGQWAWEVRGKHQASCRS